MRKITTYVVQGLILLPLLSQLAAGQALTSTTPATGTLWVHSTTSPLSVYSPKFDVSTVLPLPRVSPDLVLQAYEQRTGLQAVRLAAYSDVMLIHAELPDALQEGEYELHSHYIAPGTLQFNSVRYTGDRFVKTNVIVRLLRSESDHVRKEDGVRTAIINSNYKFSYAGTAQINGRPVHAYEVKPRLKRPGLFKGRIYLDLFAGSLVRAEGVVVKTPSFFIKRISFVQDYADFGDFTFPVHLHAVAFARVVGRVVVDIYHRDCQSVPTDRGLREAKDRATDGAHPEIVSSQSDSPAFVLSPSKAFEDAREKGAPFPAR